MKFIPAGLVLAGLMAGPALSADKYILDASHSQIVFSYDHRGFSTTYGCLLYTSPSPRDA